MENLKWNQMEHGKSSLTISGMARRDDQELEEIEIELLIEGLLRRHGIDLRGYERDALRRRIREQARQEGAQTISGLQEKALHDGGCLERLLLSLATRDGQGGPDGGMFAEPAFYSAFRDKVVPRLRTYPFLRIWLAACSMGEEVYSMAIALQEEGLYQRSRIYATEISRDAIRRAKEGAFPLSEATRYTSNYLRSGGRKYFSDYFTTRNGKIFFDSGLKRNVTFLEHNLATDGSFNEFHVVICRNAMTDFNFELQERVHELIYESLIVFGVVGMGPRESLRHSPREAFYETLDEKYRLYRKVL
jgi:chemotaxis protein methyltransferase CheR